MARKGTRRKKGKDQGGQPAWMMTFSDLMTLLLTFFILLLSMAALRDEHKEILVLGSISRTFGMGQETMSILGQEPRLDYVEPGPITEWELDDMAALKNLLWEDYEQDLEFKSNAFVQILSINSALLFEPGSNQLTPEGQELLAEIAPYLDELTFPVLLGGHTSIMADELDIEYLFREFTKEEDPSWELSLQRTLSVYRFFLDQGLDPEKLQMEAFGKHKPRFSNQTQRGREKNRRVDIILDKRNYIERMPFGLRKVPDFFQRSKEEFEFRDFRFDLD